MVGQIFGNYTVMEEIIGKFGHRECVCKCKCGKINRVRLHKLLKGLTSGCGCDKRGWMKGRKMDPDRKNPNVLRNALYSTSKSAAHNRDITWSLDKEEYFSIVTRPCFYCTIDPPERKYNTKLIGYVEYMHGIDRVNNGIGYTFDNCVSCCKICNISKNNLNLEDWIKWIERISGNVNTIKSMTLSES